MVVQHNLQAMNANRMLGLTNATMSSSTEKLSSGYKINRAADDAAGLSISEKMRKQIRGLDQASENAEDGISAVQTAEGALAEVQDMLQRMNELCVQAANETNSVTDRQSIQDEIDQLITEIDRVSETTKFNDTYLLKGDETVDTTKKFVVNYSVTYTKNIVSNSEDNAFAPEYKVNYTGQDNVYMVDRDIIYANENTALTANTISTDSDITDYMKKEGYTKEYSYNIKQPTTVSETTITIQGTSGSSVTIDIDDGIHINDAAGSLLTAENIDDSISITTYKCTYTANVDDTPQVYEKDPNATTNMGWYASQSTTEVTLTDVLQNTDITVDSTTGDVTFTWKDGSDALYAEQYDSNKPLGNQSTLISDDVLNTELQGLLANGDIFVATGALYPSANASINEALTESELYSYFDADTFGYYSSNSTGGVPAYAYDLTTSSQTYGQLVEVGTDRITDYVAVTSTTTPYDGCFDGDTLNPKTIYVYDTDPTSPTYGQKIYLDDSNISQYVSVSSTWVKDQTAVTENDSNVAFNDEDYVAFVAVELNSNLAEGVDGKVDSQVPATSTTSTTYDLSTDGTDDVVRANRDLYILNKSNSTVIHLSEGDDMTEYLTNDRTMMDGYTLVDILDSQEGASDRVKEEILGGTSSEFVWSNKYIEKDSSMQQLYNSEGEEVSGIGLREYFDDNGNYTGGLYVTSQARAIDRVFSESASENEDYINIMSYLGSDPAVIEDYIASFSTEVLGDLDFDLHVGADADRDNKINVSIQSLTAAGLGISSLHSDNVGIVDATGANATDAITVISDALQLVSTQRSALGAVQNRLDHTIKNLDNVVENTTAAESQIRDTDMAEEMVTNANASILMQAGQSMLAQANQSNQGVLTLLQ